jgi:hypothetical protein
VIAIIVFIVVVVRGLILKEYEHNSVDKDALKVALKEAMLEIDKEKSNQNQNNLMESQNGQGTNTETTTKDS